MNTLKNQIKLVNDRVSRMKPVLLGLHKGIVEMDKNQDHLDHRVSVSEEESTALYQRLTLLEEYVHSMAGHVNDAIERINALHQYLKEMERNLECDETLVSSDEDFDPDAMSNRRETVTKNQ